jgi:hypothetical protein
MRLAIVAALLLVQDGAVELKYGGKKGDKTSHAGELTLKLKIDGTEAITNLVRSSMEFLSFSEIRIKGEGVRRVTGPGAKGVGHKVEYSATRVTGVYDDEPFQFDFERGAPPADLSTQKLKQICWFLSMGGPDYRIGPLGEYASSDPNKEAWGEALDLVANGVVRLSDKPVAPGGEWTSEWKGAYKQKDNDGIFAYRQKAKLEKVEKSEARISFETTGKLEIPEGKRDKNAEVQGADFDAKGWITLNVDTGLVTSVDTSGAVRGKYKGIDPNTGETHELKIDFEVTSKTSSKDH